MVSVDTMECPACAKKKFLCVHGRMEAGLVGTLKLAVWLRHLHPRDRVDCHAKDSICQRSSDCEFKAGLRRNLNTCGCGNIDCTPATGLFVTWSK